MLGFLIKSVDHKQYEIDTTLKILKRLKETPDPNTTTGICQFYGRTRENELLAYGASASLKSALIHAGVRWEQWPKFSGCSIYPVPHPQKDAKKAWLESARPFNRETIYGKNRWELVDWLINELEDRTCLSNSRYTKPTSNR